jgi:hypothetical protein
LQSEQPYRILLITPRSTTRWDYLFVYAEGVQHILAWQKTGDPDCRKLVLIHGQTEAITWEKSIRVKTVSDLRKGNLHEASEQVESDECANDEWNHFLADKSDFLWEEL